MKTVIQKFSQSDYNKLFFFTAVILSVCGVLLFNSTFMPSTLLSILCYLLFSPIVNALERRGMGRATSILTIFLLCGILLTIGIVWIYPRLSNEITSFSAGAEKYALDFKIKLEEKENLLHHSFPFLKEVKISESSISFLQTSGARILKILPNIASQLLMLFFLVPFLSFVFLKEATSIKRGVLSLVPNRYFETVYSLVSKILSEMGGYVGARILEAALMGSMVLVLCLVFHIPYPVLLAVSVALTNPIPYLGPLIGALPGILFAVIDPVIANQLFYVVIINITVNVIDTVVIFPLLVAKIVNLHPLVVIISVILGSQAFGIVGMIVAVPLTSIIKIFIAEMYTRIYQDSQT